jgi:hypothetical protein
MTELLRQNLRDLSETVGQVDLRDRVLVGSRRAARRSRAMVAACAVVFLALVSAAAVTLPIHRGPGPEATHPPTASAGPLPTSDPTPSLAGPWTPTSDPSADRSLDGVALSIPPWPGADPVQSCAGDVVLDGGVHPFPAGPYRQVRLVKAVAHDGNGVAALWYCAMGQAGHQFQVADYQRTGSGGLDLRGQVLVSGQDGVAAMFDVAVAGAELRIEVGDWAGSTSLSEASHFSVHQWRAYRWNGSTFRQVGGPTAFAANPNFYDLGVTASDLVLGPPANGVRQGSLRVSIRNNNALGRSPASTVEVYLPAVARWRPEASTPCPVGAWHSEPAASSIRLSCEVSQVDPQTTVEFTIAVTVDSADTPAAIADPQYVQLRAAATGGGLDTSNSNDSDTFAVQAQQ